MNKKFLLSLVLMATLVPSLFLAVPKAQAQLIDPWSDPYSTNQVGFDAFNVIGFGKKDPRVIAAGVIQVLMGFLGVIAVILILVGGFKWMTAGGNDTKVGQAKQLMFAGVAGLLIVLAAFAVSIFVLRALLGVTGGTPQQTYENQ